MIEKYEVILTGKVIEILDCRNECIIRVKLKPFQIDIPEVNQYDFHLEDEIEILAKIEIVSVNKKSNFNINQIKKSEVQNE